MEQVLLPVPDIVGTGKKSIIIEGPPGTGKTITVKAAAQRMKRELFIVSAADLRNKWTGNTERRVAAMFRVVEAASPSLLFLDELESLIQDRDKKSNDCPGLIIVFL